MLRSLENILFVCLFFHRKRPAGDQTDPDNTMLLPSCGCDAREQSYHLAHVQRQKIPGRMERLDIHPTISLLVRYGSHK
ncbi:hypothetical protein KSC_002090 [Ktedonobacter sp. SOSP1-52]|nr:hypothetical protein KSC_002090 [Ktedonobacter sp. SOSP1-52]